MGWQHVSRLGHYFSLRAWKKKKKSSCIHKEKLPPDLLPNANVIAPAAEALFPPPNNAETFCNEHEFEYCSWSLGSSASQRKQHNRCLLLSGFLTGRPGRCRKNKEAQTHTCTVNEHKWIRFTLYGRSIESWLNNQRVRMPGYESASAPSYQSGCFSVCLWHWKKATIVVCKLPFSGCLQRLNVGAQNTRTQWKLSLRNWRQPCKQTFSRWASLA